MMNDNNKIYIDTISCDINKSFRYNLFPIKCKNLWNLYKKHISVEWNIEEINFSRDKEDFQQLNAEEQNFIKHVLAFFLAGDVVVGDMLKMHLIDIPVYEVNHFYTFQAYMENVHFETYSLMIDSLVLDEKERFRLFNEAKNDSVLKMKIDWIEKYIDNNVSLGERVLALAIVEGIFFSGAFAAIFWLKDRCLLPGLTFANELISRDEFLHCDFACEILNNHILNKPSKEIIKQMIESAVDLECLFYKQGLPKNLRKMNKTSMINYIKFVSDRLFQKLTSSKIYNVENPFESFMSFSALEGKTNFFERNVSEYGKPTYIDSENLDNKKSEIQKIDLVDNSNNLREEKNQKDDFNDFLLNTDF